MTPPECPRERDVVEAAMTRRLGCEPGDDLAAHVRGCAACAEIAAVTAILYDCRDETLRGARVPAAGQVWWRSALRAHAEATRAARRPLVWSLGIAGACAVAVTAALLQFAWPQLYEAIQACGSAVSAARLETEPLIRSLRSALPLIALVLAFILLTPLAAYLALLDGRRD